MLHTVLYTYTVYVLVMSGNSGYTMLLVSLYLILSLLICTPNFLFGMGLQLGVVWGEGGVCTLKSLKNLLGNKRNC
jgi:hypothetical protein